MTTYKKPYWTTKNVSISNLELIQSELLNVVQEFYSDIENLQPEFYGLNVDVVKAKLPTLCEQFKQWKILDRWKHMAFITGNKGISVPMHVDSIDWQSLNFALNIPVLNCDNTYTAFYVARTETDIINFDENDYRYPSRLCDEESANEFTRVELNKPYWVNICAPHKPIMMHDKPRVLASFRFTPELHDVIDSLILN